MQQGFIYEFGSVNAQEVVFSAKELLFLPLNIYFFPKVFERKCCDPKKFLIFSSYDRK
jgi:hypothetical protein